MKHTTCCSLFTYAACGYLAYSNIVSLSLHLPPSPFRLPSLQNNNVELKEVSLQPSTDGTTHSDANTPEAIVQEKTDSKASDIDAASDMYRGKSQAVGSGLRGQGTSQATAFKRGLKAESGPTTASGAKTPSSAAGSQTKNVTTKMKVSTESRRVGTSSDKTVSILPTLKDQSSSSLSAKSKIPKRTASDSDMKSTVTPNKPSVTDTSGSKVQKLLGSKEALKTPLTATKAGRKQSVEEKAPSGDIAPTKATHKMGTKLIQEKPDEHSINLVNGVEKDREERSVRTGQRSDREASPGVKQGQNRLENNASLVSKSRLPVSSATNKTSDEITQTSGTDNKRTTSGPSDSDGSSTVQKQSPEQRQVTPGQRPGSETPTPLPGSPKKGKTVRPLRVACCVLGVVCCVLRAGCWVLGVACWVSRAGGCVLRAGGWVLRAGGWVLHVGCCMLGVACCMLQVACCVWCVATRKAWALLLTVNERSNS